MILTQSKFRNTISRKYLLGKRKNTDQSNNFISDTLDFVVFYHLQKKSYTASQILLTTPKLKISDLGVISPRRASGAI